MKNKTTAFAAGSSAGSRGTSLPHTRGLKVAWQLLAPLAAAVCVLLLAADLGWGGNTPNVLGQSPAGEAALMGIFYDLKLTASHQTSDITPGNYANVVHEFIAQKWNERVLNRYYRVSQPIYTTQIFDPYMNSDEVPKAFGVEKLVKPTRWLIHYKGQVSAPAPGTYRFWGASDDVLIVAINSKTELVACYPDIQDKVKENCWQQTERDGAQVVNQRLHPGDWFTVGANEIIDFDALTGDRPGGQYYAFLLIEKKGDTYQRDSDHNPILPIFQLAPYNTPVINDLHLQPKFAKGFPVWKCYQ